MRRLLVIAALVCGCAAPSFAQGVKMEFRDGRVFLTAQNAPVRTILNEWARLGGTKIVNGERLTGAPVTLELNGVPERQALDILLRSATGYMAGPRQAGQAGQSAYASILILPTSSGVRTASSGPVQQPNIVRNPVIRQIPQFVPPPQGAVDPDDDPAGDVAEEINEALPPAERAAALARQLRRRVDAARPFVPGQDDDAPEQKGPPQTPSNPFGIQFGSSQPGTISPVAPQVPQQQRPKVDPEP